jgi:hypothetical protein
MSTNLVVHVGTIQNLCRIISHNFQIKFYTNNLTGSDEGV